MRSIAPIAVLALAAAGCGGGSDASTSTSTSPGEGTSLTRTQAQTLARVLSNNTERGGARFLVRDPLRDGRTLVMTGRIDFPRSKGEMLLRVEGADGSLTRGRRIFWRRASVWEGDIPGLEAAMAKRGRQGVTWVTRTASLDQGPVDETIAVLNKLAAPKPENPVLLQQGENAYIGTDRIDGRPVEVFRVGSTRLTITSPEALLVRLDARIGTALQTGRVELAEHGPQAIELPSTAVSVPLASIRPLYRSLIERARG